MNKKILIVGTGLGGISTGLRLAVRGYDVTFVEKNSKPGGRLNQIQKQGFTFDIGPSFFSMPFEFEAFIKDCGLEMPFEFVELDPLYTVNFSGSEKKYMIYKDIDKLSEQFVDVEPEFKEKFTRYLKKCEAIYNDTMDVVIKQNFNSIPQYLMALLQVNPKHLPAILRNFWKQVNVYFDSNEAKQIVSLISFFLGRTPFDTNAVYTLLSHIEFTHTGYYNVKGGMYTIVKSLTQILADYNVKFNFNTEIKSFQSSGKTLTGLVDQNGKVWTADIFVINADAAAFRGLVLKRKKFRPEKLDKLDWTMGYLTFYLGINTKLPQVEHHNYFVGNNYNAYAKNVMTDLGTQERPYYYVNVLSKHNDNCAPEGHEALFFVCPVPNLIYKQDWSNKEEIVQSIVEDFSNRIKQNISEHIVFKEIYTPYDWQNQFNIYQGGGLGLSHHMMQIGAFRPKNYDEFFKNTFYVGGSTTPGAGLPMTVISSKLVTERLVEIDSQES
jgi:phytoene desaturase